MQGLMGREMKKLYRSRKDRVLFGVCGGIGEYLGVDPVIIRLIFVILALSGGMGIALYIIAFILIPDETDLRNKKDSAKTKNKSSEKKSEFEETIESVAHEIRTEFENKKDFTGEKIMGIILIFLGSMLLLQRFFPGFSLRILGPIMLIFIGLLLLGLTGRGEKK